MSANSEKVSNYIRELLQLGKVTDLAVRLAPDHSVSQAAIPRGFTKASMQSRLDLLDIRQEHKADITDADYQVYSHNIENYIGTIKVPVGIAGPLRVNGLFAKGDYLVPLATTEAALVFSYSRGANLITAAGGCSSTLVAEGVSRAPGFVFDNIVEAGQFVFWVLQQTEVFKQEAAKTTKHGKLVDVKLAIEGNHVYLNLEYYTADASGQNMATIASEQICDYIKQHSPVKPNYSFIEANLSGDKKASFQSFQSVRGKKVTTEIVIPSQLVKKFLRTTARRMEEYWRISAIGGSLTGTIGMQGHYANGLAAVYMACGQDVACVSESAVGITRLEMTENGDLYAAVTLPNLMVGTVGGGTGLPSQRACLEIMGLYGNDKARAFAEVCSALCLAGELSIMGALCAGDFSKAHKVLARLRR